MKFLHTFHLAAYCDTLLSYSLALVLGAAIGAERQFRQRTAGLRTNALVALGSAAFVDLAQRIAGDLEAVRVISYVVSGIGFLGAGVIVHADQSKVKGLTSAACVWFTACIGIVCGLGLWRLVIVALAIALLLLVLGGPVERALHRIFGVNPDSTSQD